MIWGVLLAAVIYGAVLWWMVWSQRGWSRKAKTKRRLLVKDQDGLPVWRTLRARVLVGWIDRHGAITSGTWAKSGSGPTGDVWAVLQTPKGQLVAYRFDQRNPDDPYAPKTGVVLRVCDSWRELESITPAAIFEEALLEAGIKKPREYREAPLEL